MTTEAFNTDYLTFVTTYMEKRYDVRIDEISCLSTTYTYATIAQFIAFASVTLAISEDTLLNYIGTDNNKLREISYCCLDKRQWNAVKAKMR